MTTDHENPEKQKVRRYISTDTTDTNKKLSFRISQSIAYAFFRVGFTVALHPIRTIVLSILFTLVCSSGFFFFRAEKNPLKLWIPQESNFLRDTEWLMKSFKEGPREQSVLLTAPDVLEPSVLQSLLKISKAVNRAQVQLENGTSYTYENICFKIPIIRKVTSDFANRGRRSADSSFDDNDFDTAFKKEDDSGKPPFNPSVHLSTELFCGIVNSLPLGCMLKNILELWDFDEEKINRLTKNDVLEAINTRNVSVTTGHEANFQQLLSGVERNETHIIAATGILSQWMVYVNFSDVDHEKVGNMAGTEDWASEEALLWEDKFLDTLKSFGNNFTDDEIEVYYSAGRSYGDISAATMFQDMGKISLGSIMMFVYMTLILSKFGWTEIRVALGGLGLLSVGMAFASAIGVCSMLGIPYGPVHTSLPFLLMGLGVDDIFVLMASWRRLQKQLSPMKDVDSIPERMGIMLKSAGASITLTSFTDIVAFSVGSITVLPSLQSFCRYAAFGVFFTWVMAITFFVAIFTLDERRILDNRNSLAPCIVHQPTRFWAEPNIFHRGLHTIMAKGIMTKAGKIIVLMSTVCMTAFSLRGLLNLEQRFDPNWFIPSDTYLNRFTVEKRRLYPDQGYEAMIMMGRLNYTSELDKIRLMIQSVENRTDLVHEISNWLMPFHDFVQTYYRQDIFASNFNDTDFRKYLTKFLWSPSGGKYQANIRFEKKLECGKPSPNIAVSTIEFKYRRFRDRSGYVPAMHTMGDIVHDTKLNSGDGFSTVWARVYGNWITDEIIDSELIRNLAMALVCVMICTIVLIADWQICCWIFVCILLTLVNVCGGMEYWGLTIDLVSCIGLQLAVGLCVDYAAHIGHTFLTFNEGTRSDRALATVMHIGPAVLNGGVSTILAMAMLANSNAYTFKAFFKIFLLVIIFGLYFGIVFLPVVLSLVGPDPYGPMTTTRKVRASHTESNANGGTEMKSFIASDERTNEANESKENDQLSH